jgi:hypothetical protein
MVDHASSSLITINSLAQFGTKNKSKDKKITKKKKKIYMINFIYHLFFQTLFWSKPF